MLFGHFLHCIEKVIHLLLGVARRHGNPNSVFILWYGRPPNSRSKDTVCKQVFSDLNRFIFFANQNWDDGGVFALERVETPLLQVVPYVIGVLAKPLSPLIV